MRPPFYFLLAICCTVHAQQPPVVLTVDQAIQEAIANNLDLAAARYDVKVAEARQITASLRPNPVASVSADHLDLLGTGFNILNAAGPPEYAARTDFLLERGGKRTARMEFAAAEKSVTELRFRDAMRKLIFDVQSAFVEVQLAKERVTLAQDNLRSLNAIVAINTERVRTGDLAGVELDRSRLAAMQYETAVRQAELQSRDARIRLQFLIGRPIPDEQFDVTGPIRRDTALPVFDEIRSRALTGRPDLLETRRSQARNQADIRLQLAQGRIDYTTGVEYRRQQGINGTGNMVGFFFSTPIPIFNKNQGEIARAQHEAAQAAAQVRALEARIGTEVSSAWQQYSTSRSMLEDIEQRMLGKARDVRDTTEYSYRRGEASLIEFLDAQRAFNDVMQSYTEVRGSYAKSLYLIDTVAPSTP